MFHYCRCPEDAQMYVMNDYMFVTETWHSAIGWITCTWRQFAAGTPSLCCRWQWREWRESHRCVCLPDCRDCNSLRWFLWRPPHLEREQHTCIRFTNLVPQSKHLLLFRSCSALSCHDKWSEFFLIYSRKYCKRHPNLTLAFTMTVLYSS